MSLTITRMLRVLRLRSVIIPSYQMAITTTTNTKSSCFHTASVPHGLFGPPQEESFFKRVGKRLGWTETSRSLLKAYGYLMFIKVADEVDYMNFFKYCELEDTFASWFIILELHMWMISARLMQEGDEGKIVRNSMIKAMWEDCDVRSKQLEGALASARKKQIQTLNEEFQATLISYDEGLLGDDTVLAGAVWRRFLRNNAQTKPEDLLKQAVALELLVIYIRSQYFNLNELSREQLLKRKFKWAPFDKKLFELTEKVVKRAVHA